MLDGVIFFALLHVIVFLYLQDARGNDVDLSQYKGKVLLIVNVASQWYVETHIFYILLSGNR